jgi:2-keto-4-pentenoate hydratase/2-oxohepta-3-ene-1,7-dioic acid hydratase in catechol pathway
MRLVSYDRGGARRLGAVVDGIVYDLPAAVGHPAFPASMEALVARNGGTTLDAARDALERPDYLEGCDLEEVDLLVPYFPRNLARRRTILEPGEPVPWDVVHDEVDYRLELGCIVGRRLRRATPEEAEDAIFGYTVLVDWVGRRRARVLAGTSALSPGGRDEPFALSLGPSVVTTDEFDPTHGLMTALVDGSVWSSWDLADARGSFAELISRVSHENEVMPGDVLASGPFPGGCARDLGRALEPGMRLGFAIEGIGSIAATVGDRI